jgi:hypothetical protein
MIREHFPTYSLWVVCLGFFVDGYVFAQAPAAYSAGRPAVWLAVQVVGLALLSAWSVRRFRRELRSWARRDEH